MAREFEVNENGVTAEGFKVLHPKMKKAMRTGTLIYTLFFLVVALLIGLLGKEALGEYYWPLLILFIAIVLLLCLDLVFVPIIFYARYRYNVGEDRIDVLRGVFIIKHVVVPVERIHQVEVTRGPINNLFGLANVAITTAGGVASIEYLELQEAEGIADKLNEKVIRILKERE